MANRPERWMAEQRARPLLSSAEAASRLGVKPETLYAYVSRGLLRRERSPDGRRSWFDPAEVERVAGRGRQGAGPPGGPLSIESGITAIYPAGHRYRGLDAVALAGERRFEEVANWLWTGQFGDRAAVWHADAPGLRVGRATQSVLPADTLPLERLRVITAALATADELRLQLDPPAVVAVGQSLLASMVECLPDAAAQPDPPAKGSSPPQAGRRQGQVPPAGPPSQPEAGRRQGQVVPPAGPPSPPDVGKRPGQVSPAGPSSPLDVGTRDPSGLDVAKRDPSQPDVGKRPGQAPRAVGAGIAERLWGKLTAAEPEPPLVGALDAALVLLADHELAASTLAARAAASVRADPYAVVSAGLAVASGTLHAGASLDIEGLLAEAGRPDRAARVVGERLRRGGRIRGFGHFVYTAGDPRASYLLERLRAIPAAVPVGGEGGADERLAVADAVLAAAEHRRLPPPNVDFALATLASMTGMIAGAGEAIFVIARTAGWLAHALEEYQRGVPLRPRAIYTGSS
jgi:citrate synthase